MKQTVGIYLRPTEPGMTEAEQRQLLEPWIASTAESVRIFIDDKGGFQRERLEELLDQAQTGELSTVAVARLDRLDMALGSEAEFLSFLRTLTENGVRFVSIDDGLDSMEAAGIFFNRLEPALRKAREVVRAERIRLSLKRSKEEGHQLGRPRAADYEQILSLRQQGLSIQAIADRLEISRGAVQHCLRTADGPDQGPA